MSLTDNDLETLAQMETAVNNRGGDSADLYSNIDYDGSEASGFLFTEAVHPFECTDLELFTSQKGDRGLKATQRCFAGPDAGKEIVDILMLEGKGAGKSANFFSAVGVWDAENKRPTCRYIDLIGKKTWATVATEESEWQGKVRQKSVIPFGAYEPIAKYQLPQEFDADFEEAFTEPEVAPEPEPPKPAAKPRPKGPGTTPPWPGGN